MLGYNFWQSKESDGSQDDRQTGPTNAPVPGPKMAADEKASLVLQWPGRRPACPIEGLF